jgi:hypothetical protein
VKINVGGEVICRLRVRARGPRCGDSAGAVLLAARLVADYTPFEFSGAVTLMRRLAPAACMHWRAQSLHCNRKEASGEREQQEQSGGQALHFFS